MSNQKLLLPFKWKQSVASWLEEDCPSFDYGGYVVGDQVTVATLWMKDSGVIAGVPFFNEVFRLLRCSVEWSYPEGSCLTLPIDNDRISVGKVYGEAKDILLGERLALNIIARASGIATRANRLLKLKEENNWRGIIAGTRKTTPGFRIVEKYAMLVGGSDAHRYDLSSMIMLKDNHIQAAGDITKAVSKARSVGGFSIKIEVECSSIESARIAIEAGADMLDNFDGAGIHIAALALKEEYKDRAQAGSFLIEGSGGLTESNIAAYFSPAVDILSCGSLSQSVPHIDFSLKL